MEKMIVNSNIIEFWLNDREKIALEMQDPLYEVDCCYEGLIRFIYDKHNMLLSHDAIRDSMYVFGLLLREALNNTLPLHGSITKDIGFLYNQYSYRFWTEDSIIVDGFVYDGKEDNKDWVGIKYHLWASDRVSWIYNDKDGLIIFEVTPFYPYLHSKPEKESNYISYEQWIKDYKPYVIRTISKGIAQKWLDQANTIVQQIDTNIERWSKQSHES